MLMTEPPDRVRAKTAAILQTEMAGVLALGGGTGEPYAALVAFQASPDLRDITFATLRDTRKYARIQVQPEVALLVDTRRRRPEDLTEAEALTTFGVVSEPESGERTGLAQAFVARFPALREFVADPRCVLLRLHVRRFSLVERFQQVSEWSPL